MAGSLVNATVGCYRFIDFIGAGGMGEVYRAIDERNNRVVAVKVLNAGKTAPNALERFRNEARIHATVRHPNIATMYESLELNGAPCIVMEYVDGETIDQRIRSQGAFAFPLALEIFERIVDAVGYLHSRGIIHRDLKANNVKVGEHGLVKVLDFGIAKTQDSPKLTVSGAMIGTPQYVSPEQLRGQRADERTDIWALGVLFYEMLTGRMPFEANNIAALMDRVAKGSYTAPSRRNPRLSRSVDRVVELCLQPNPDQRCQSAELLLADVRALSEAPAGAGTSLAAKAAGMLQLGGARKQLPIIAAMTAAGAAFAFLLYALFAPGGESTTSGEADTPTVAAGKGVAATAVPATAARGERDPNVREIVLTLGEGTAQVFSDSGLVGNTPYTVRASLGDRVSLVLRRNGYEDQVVNFLVTDGLSPRFTYYLRPRLLPPGPAARAQDAPRNAPAAPLLFALGAPHG